MESKNKNVEQMINEEKQNEAVDENMEVLKKRIMQHPMIGVLIQSHFSCLNVGLGSIGDVSVTASLDDTHVKLNCTAQIRSDLDHFMEEYCMALAKLREAMEKPIKETETFISGMYAQLNELSSTNTASEFYL